MGGRLRRRRRTVGDGAPPGISNRDSPDGLADCRGSRPRAVIAEQPRRATGDGLESPVDDEFLLWSEVRYQDLG